MIDDAFLQMLACPASGQPLRAATEAELRGVAAAIAAGRVHNRGGTVVESAPAAGLATVDGAWLYPVRDGIPILLAAEALPLAPSAPPGVQRP